MRPNSAVKSKMIWRSTWLANRRFAFRAFDQFCGVSVHLLTTVPSNFFLNGLSLLHANLLGFLIPRYFFLTRSFFAFMRRSDLVLTLCGATNAGAIFPSRCSPPSDKACLCSMSHLSPGMILRPDR